MMAVVHTTPYLIGGWWVFLILNKLSDMFKFIRESTCAVLQINSNLLSLRAELYDYQNERMGGSTNTINPVIAEIDVKKMREDCNGR